MLKLLRKKGLAKKVIWFVAIIIIFSFGFFGTAYLITGDAGSSYAGKIYGKKVSIDDFNKVYKNTRIQAIRQYGANLDQVAEVLNLEAQTWDRMILLHEAKKRKIKVTNDEIVDAINNDPSFEKAGRFDNLLYNAILRNLQIRPRDYEENVRDNLKITELYKQVTASVTISEEEVLEEYRKRNEKVQTSYVLVASDAFKEEVEVDDAEIKEYFEAHESEFLEPASVNVNYLNFDFSQSETDSEDQKDLVRDNADQVFQQLLINPNMDQVAAENNLTVKTSGFFSMEQPNLSLGWSYDLLNKIFKMSENEIHEPHETTTGVSIVQIKEKREPYVPELSKAADKAREAVAVEKSKTIAQTKANEYLRLIKEEMGKSKVRDFAKSAKALGLDIHQTPEFSRGQYLPQVGISKEFEETAFGLNENNKLSGVVEIANGYCILHLDHHVPVDQNEFEQAKNDLAQSISDEKQNAAFSDYVSQLRVEAGLVDNFAQLRADAAQ